MIDKSKEFWTGNDGADIAEYLRSIPDCEVSDVAPVQCSECGGVEFMLESDTNEGAIEVECAKCHHKKLLLDSADFWEDSEPEKVLCPTCGGERFNVGVGFARRETGEVKWVYIGNRCVKCSLLGFCCDWKIDYGPTDEMEKNL